MVSVSPYIEVVLYIVLLQAALWEWAGRKGKIIMSTYLNYLAWCANAGIPNRMILSESEWQRQTADLYEPKCTEAAADES